MPYFMCCECFVPLTRHHSTVPKHVANVCKNAKILCVPCGKNVGGDDLERHQNCKLPETIDSASASPGPLSARLLSVLREAKASPELSKKAEELLTSAAPANVHKLPIKTVVQDAKVVASPELKELVITVYAREPIIFAKKSFAKIMRWKELVLATFAKTEMSEENRKALKKILNLNNIPSNKGKKSQTFCENSCKTSESRDLAVQIFAEARAAMDKSPVATKGVDPWASQLLQTVEDTPMSGKNKEQIKQIFATSQCSYKTKKISEYVESHFPTQKLKDLATLVLTKARASFVNQVKSEQKQPKANLLQNGDKLKKKGQRGSGPAGGNQKKSKKAELQKKGEPSQQPDTKHPKQEPSSDQKGKKQGKLKRKAEPSLEEGQGAKNKQPTKKIKGELQAKTMEKDKRQKGNVFPKPISGKKNKRGKQKMGVASAREPKTKSN